MSWHHLPYLSNRAVRPRELHACNRYESVASTMGPYFLMKADFYINWVLFLFSVWLVVYWWLLLIIISFSFISLFRFAFLAGVINMFLLICIFRKASWGDYATLCSGANVVSDLWFYKINKICYWYFCSISLRLFFHYSVLWLDTTLKN